MFDTDLVAFLIAAVVVALATAGPRAPLRSGWFYAGGGIALGLWAPYLAWQGSHGWPELAVAGSIAAGGPGAWRGHGYPHVQPPLVHICTGG